MNNGGQMEAFPGEARRPAEAGHLGIRRGGDEELTAIRSIGRLLDKLSTDESRRRVVRYAAERYGC